MSLQQRANNEEENAHADGRDEKRQSTTESVRQVENEKEGGNQLDDAINTGCQEGVRVAGVANLPGSNLSIICAKRVVYSPTGKSEEHSIQQSSGHSTAEE